MTFGEKLKQLRNREALSQEALAEALHVSRQAVTKWEGGGGLPDIENLKAVADLFGVTLDSLVRDGEEPETTEDDICWKASLACGGIGMTLGFLLPGGEGLDFVSLGLGGVVIGYAVSYLILLFRKKK